MCGAKKNQPNFKTVTKQLLTLDDVYLHLYAQIIKCNTQIHSYVLSMGKSVCLLTLMYTQEK